MRREPTGATIAALAARQGGVVSRRQLMTDVGLSASAVDRRLRGGQLHLVHRGVYAVGHRLLRREGWWFAAVLASGVGAVVSHTDAAAALGLAPPRSGPVHVTLVARGRRRTTGVRTHCTRALPRAEVTTVDGLRTTSVGRTLLDLAPRCSERRLEQLISEADMRQRFDLEEVRAVLARAPTRQGAGRLACLLDRLEGVGAAFTRSDLEIAMLALCDAYDLPRPQANARVHGFEVDFWWPDARVVVETDSWRWHRMPTRREADAAKRLHLQAAGVRVVVLTFAQIRDAPSDVAHALRPLVSAVVR